MKIRNLLIIFFISLYLSLFASFALASSNQTYEYDANGNLIQGDGKYYEYNDANKLVRVKLGDQNGPVITQFVYDHKGQRTKKIENGKTTYYIGRHLEKIVLPDSIKETKYYFVGPSRVAKKDQDDNLSFYHPDHLGGTNVITDSSGNVVERTNYYPFGDIRSGGKEQYTYTGKEKDTSTDLYYFEARYYKYGFRHFIQPDWVEVDLYNPQELNRYAYVGNNPVKNIDPTGNYISPLDMMDYASFAHSAYTMCTDPSLENAGWLALDTAMVIIPGLGGAGLMAKSGKAGTKAIKTADHAGDAAKVTKKGRSLSSRSKIQKIDGRNPINSKYAGKTHPSGVKFNEKGFPDFRPYSQVEIKIKGLTGNYTKDAAMANKAMNYPSTPKGYVWHHVEDAKTMLLIPQDVHNAVRHTGGAAIIRHGSH